MSSPVRRTHRSAVPSTVSGSASDLCGTVLPSVLSPQQQTNLGDAMSLTLRPETETEFDVLTLGECMIRLSPPGHQRIELTPVFEAYAGGGEYNVSYALARYGMRTGWISRLVENPLGQFIRNHAQASGMDLSEVVWVPYDGSGRADRIGLNFTEVGIGVRASVTMYDRGHTAVA